MKKVDQNNDHSGDPPPDLESIRKDVQKCRENRERLLREKALQRRFQKEEPEERMRMSDDEEKERIRRRNIGLIVQLEWEKLESEKKRRLEQIGVGDEEEEEEEEYEPRKSDASPRFQDSNNSKIGVEGSGSEMAIEMKNHIQKMGGTNVKLLVQRRMCRTDEVSHFQVPIKQIKREFLTKDEERTFWEEGMEVKVAEPSLQHAQITVRKRKKNNGHIYVFTNKNWIDFVQRNALREGTLVQLWSFRNIDSELCFAFNRCESTANTS